MSIRQLMSDVLKKIHQAGYLKDFVGAPEGLTFCGDAIVSCQYVEFDEDKYIQIKLKVDSGEIDFIAVDLQVFLLALKNVNERNDLKTIYPGSYQREDIKAYTDAVQDYFKDREIINFIEAINEIISTETIGTGSPSP